MTIVRTPQEGERLWFNSSLLTFKATSAETNGAFVLFEMVSPRGKATPLHLHPTEDESFYVIEGELMAHVDGRELTAGPGGFVSFPRGTPHAFTIVSEQARFLTLFTPGPVAAEAFFHDGGEPAQGDRMPPEGPLDIARIKASAEKHGSVQLLGPPPFAQPAAAAGASAVA
jgi:quercetin dioxygenase-like cupin family protein